VSLIAIIQWSVAGYLLFFVGLTLINPVNNLSSLESAFHAVTGLTFTHIQSSKEDIFVELLVLCALSIFLALGSAIAGWGLWRLKKWARHALIVEYGVSLVFWARGFLFFGVGGGFSHVPQSALQSVYILIAIEALIFLTLLLSGGIAEAFGEIE